MAVSGDEESRHGIILAKNELARAFGVKTAEPVWQAKKKCPDLVLASVHFDEYKKYSKIINEIYREYTDRVEPFGIDESYLDVTASFRLFGSGKEIADTLRHRIREETGLTISVGVSFNKVFAKLGSDYKKPDATTVISRENFKEIVYPLPINALLFVGHSIEEKLLRLNIKTIGDIADCDKEFLKKHFGKHGELLYVYATGNDSEPVKKWDDISEAKSIGKGQTFPSDIPLDEEIIKKSISPLCENVAKKLRESSKKCQTVQVTIKGTDFKSISRQKQLDRATNITKDILDCSLKIIFSSWKKEKLIRSITVTVCSLCDESSPVQLSMFDTFDTQKKENLESTLDQIRLKYGNNSVISGSDIK